MNLENDYNAKKVYETEVTGFSNLRKKMVDSQIWLSFFNCPFAGSFFITLLILDLLGNILGFPVMSGFIIEFAEEADTLFSSLAWAICSQIILLLISIFFIAHSEKTIWAFVLGSLSGLTFAITCFLLGGIGIGKFDNYAFISLNNKDILTFRILEALIFLFTLVGCMIVIFRAFVAKGAIRREMFYRVISLESDPDSEVVYEFDFTRTNIPQSFVYIDQNITSKTIVLRQMLSNSFTIENLASRLPFSFQEYMVFNLKAFQNRIGQSASDIIDDGSFFQFSINYLTQSRSFETLGQKYESLRTSGLDRSAIIFMVQHFFRNDNMRLFLDTILHQSINQFVDQDKDPSKETAQDFRDAQEKISREANSAALKILGKSVQKLQTGEFSAIIPQSSILGTERLEAQIETFKTLRDDQFNAWRIIRKKSRSARKSLPEIFKQNLHETLSNNIMASATPAIQHTIDCLIECSGLNIMVDRIQFHEGASQESEKYFENTEKSQCEMITSLDSRITESCFQALTNESQRNHEIRLQIIRVLEGIMPYCLSADRQSVDAVIDRIFNLVGGNVKIQPDILQPSIEHSPPNSISQHNNSNDQSAVNQEEAKKTVTVSNDRVLNENQEEVSETNIFLF